jgi:hypothetical protein
MPPPKNKYYQMTIVRNKSGFLNSFNPVYHMYFSENMNIHVLSAKKKSKGKKTQYIFSMKKKDFDSHSENVLAYLFSNVWGTKFKLYSKGIHYENKKYLAGKIPRDQLRKELLYIYYDRNFMGWNGPRKMQIFQPKFNPKKAGFLKIKPTVREESIEYLSSKYNKTISKNPEFIQKQSNFIFIKLLTKEKKSELKSVSQRSYRDSKFGKLFKEDEDMEMIKQNMDFSDQKQVIDFMDNVLLENKNILNQQEEKTIKKQIK